jgi:hypothetical protein
MNIMTEAAVEKAVTQKMNAIPNEIIKMIGDRTSRFTTATSKRFST